MENISLNSVIIEQATADSVGKKLKVSGESESKIKSAGMEVKKEEVQPVVSAEQIVAPMETNPAPVAAPVENVVAADVVPPVVETPVASVEAEPTPMPAIPDVNAIPPIENAEPKAEEPKVDEQPAAAVPEVNVEAAPEVPQKGNGVYQEVEIDLSQVNGSAEVRDRSNFVKLTPAMIDALKAKKSDPVKEAPKVDPEADRKEEIEKANEQIEESKTFIASEDDKPAIRSENKRKMELLSDIAAETVEAMNKAEQEVALAQQTDGEAENALDDRNKEEENYNDRLNVEENKEEELKEAQANGVLYGKAVDETTDKLKILKRKKEEEANEAAIRVQENRKAIERYQEESANFKEQAKEVDERIKVLDSQIEIENINNDELKSFLEKTSQVIDLDKMFEESGIQYTGYDGISEESSYSHRMSA